MYATAQDIFYNFSPYVLPSIMIALSAVISTVCFTFAVKLIQRQIKLYNSITLVQLKSFKLHYMLFLSVICFFIVYTAFQMIDPYSPEVLLLSKYFRMERWQSNLMLSFLVVLLAAIAFLLVVLIKSKSAVVDKGIYASQDYLDWYHVHDYIIDEEKCVVILTSARETFATISGTTPPLRVAKNDIPKLKFILNKNKNKFSNFSNDKL